MQGFFQSFDFDRNVLALAELEKKIEAGDDINTFLSKDARSKGFMGDRRKKVVNPEKDLILNAFSLHHLHLVPKGKGDDLIFAHFDRSCAYLVIAGNHKSFMDGSVAEAYARIQASSGDFLRGLRPSREPTDFRAQIKLAHMGLSSMSQIDGMAIAGPWLVTSVHSLRHLRHANFLSRIITDIDSQLDDRPYAKKLFANAPTRLGDQTNFRWALNYTDLFLIEETSNIALLVREGFC